MSEMAMVSASKVRLQQRSEAGSAGAAAALQIADDPNRFLSTVQIGITLVGILAGAFGGATLSTYLVGPIEGLPVVGRYAEPVAFALVVTTITYLSLIIGELVPKRIALQNPETLASIVARPMLTISRGAAPIVWILGTSTNFVLRVMRIRSVDEATVTEDEIAILLEQGAHAGVFEQSEHEMVMNVFDLGDRIAADIMTPRVRIVSIDQQSTQDEILQIVAESSHASFPIVDGDLDTILGVASINNLWQAAARGEAVPVGELAQASFVPETMPIFRLLEHFRNVHADIVFVVNEYGSVEGIVTLTDVVDEILGEAERVHVDNPIVQRADGSWLIDGLVSLHDIDDVVGVQALEDWSEDRYHTLGGFVMDELGRIPETGDIVAWNGWSFEIVDMDGHRVDKVLVTAPEPDPAPTT